MQGNLYKITNAINGKVYIGKTYETLEKRFAEHIKDSKKFINRPLYKAFNKYGSDNFTIELIGTYDEGILEQKEIEEIQKHHSHRLGYNATLGGDGKKYFPYSEQEVISKYIELQYVSTVAQFFDCDVSTIRKILRSNNIDINMHYTDTQNKCVMYDIKGNTIKEFSSNSEAARYLIENKITTSNYYAVRKGICKVTCGHRKSYLGFKWSSE